MKFNVHLESGENLTNFAIAEAVYRFCKETKFAELDAKAVAKMMLIQKESEDTE